MKLRFKSGRVKTGNGGSFKRAAAPVHPAREWMIRLAWLRLFQVIVEGKGGNL